MKKIILFIIFLFICQHPCRANNDNISNYTFSQTIGTFNSIHTTGTYIAAGCTSTVFGNLPIGFSFIYNGTPYSQFGLCCSGWISMGPGAPNTSQYPLSTGPTNNVISAFGAQLSSTVAGDGIYYKTEGSAPDRILTVEWWQYGFWFNGFDEISFQIKLYETTNEIRFVYTTNDIYSIKLIQVGLRGSSNSDFNNRQTTTDWTQTTAGTTNTAACSFQSGVTPPSGLTFIFTPPLVRIENISTEIPDNFKLYQNYPNPFNPVTKIKFDISGHPPYPPSKGEEVVSLKVFDISGKEIATLVNEQLNPGSYEVTFDARLPGQGSNFASGIYFYKLTTRYYIETKRMVLLK